MNASNELLSQIVAFRTYAKYLPHLARRESLEESINRDMIMHLDRFPKLSRDITKAFQKVHSLYLMPSMRSLQFAGDAILKNNVRQYNCSFTLIDRIRAFSEILFILLSGTGAGYSVQRRHTNKLPKVGLPRQEGRFVVQDSISGWAQAVEMLMQAYFNSSVRPVFDFSDISPKGTYLVTTGAKAPGPEALRYMLNEVEKLLKLAIGRKLKPIEVHDIICLISDCVLAGGIRRAACIVLFDRDDKEMLTCKSGEWYLKYPHRARANNSAVLPRSEVSKEEFLHIFKTCQESGSGEPGFSWTDNVDWGFNPCHEISLQNKQFCNLTTINQTGVVDKKDFLSRIYSATLIGTLQASYTNFPYLDEEWQTTTEKEALLGVSFTGIADANIPKEWLVEGAKYALEINEKYAKKLGINLAARVGAVKPEGSTSTILGSASGVHARHSSGYYLRRVRMSKNDALANYLSHIIPELCEDDVSSSNTMIFTVPQESPKGCIGRDDESALDLFNRSMMYNEYWVSPTHRSGDNKHNVSATISVKDDEWDSLAKAMWQQRHNYSGISLLPYDNSSYKQMPFETCDEETFNKYNKLVKTIDLKQVREEQDNTSRLDIIACAGGVCSLEI